MLYKNTTEQVLLEVLDSLMGIPSLKDFRLVGGTALSLLKGHRMSEDIDLFTHLPYGTVNFRGIEADIKERFSYVFNRIDKFPQIKAMPEHFGITLHIANGSSDPVKVDIMNWSEPFLDEVQIIDNIRMASVREIALMKLEVISKKGRKKDFWDIAEILKLSSLSELLTLYSKKYPYNSVADVKQGLINFSRSDLEPDPICLKNRSWEEIKKEITKKQKELTQPIKKNRGRGL
jgi:hypothetical protein